MIGADKGQTPALDGQNLRIGVVQARFNTKLQKRLDEAVWSAGGCKSWYLDDRGVPMSWPWTFDRFRAEMAAPKLEAFEREG